MPQLDWNATINAIRESLPQTQFQNWFKPMRLIRHDETSVVLGVPSRFHEEWIRSHYSDQLHQAIREQCGTNLQLEFEVLLREENVEAAQSPLPAPIAMGRPTLRVVGDAPPHEESPEEADLGRPFEANYPRFEHPYFELDFNHMAAQCVRLFVENKVTLSPLVFHAGVGMGKTHLLSEVGRLLQQKNASLRIRYVTAENFTAEMVQAIKSNTIMGFKQRYRNETDVLLFDDVQVLSGRLRTQEELLHIFNSITGQGGRVVFSSSQPINRLEEFIDPLRSRLISGVIAEVKAPTFDEKVALLAHMCEQNRMMVDGTALRSMADKGQRDIRELIGSLLRLHLQATLENKSLDASFLSQGSWQEEKTRENVTMDEIISLVEHNFGVNRDDLVSKSRKSAPTWARQVAMYLARHYTLMPLEEIGKTFGRDHATVIHAFQKVAETMESQPTRRYEVEFLKQKLSNRAPETTPNPF